MKQAIATYQDHKNYISYQVAIGRKDLIFYTVSEIKDQITSMPSILKRG